MSQPGKVRILILNHYDRLSPRVEHEIHALSEAGYEIHVLSWARFEVGLPAALPGTSFEFLHYPAPKGTIKLLFYLPRLYWRVIQKLRGRSFDIVHCTHIMLLPLAVILKRHWDAKAIYDVYEFHLQETAERLPKWLAWIVPLLRKVEGWLVRRVDGVLTIDSAGQKLERYYRRFQPNITALYNVPEVNLSWDQDKLEDLRRRYEGREIVLYIGGLSAAKGIFQALEAAQIVVDRRPQALFLFIGTFHHKEEEADFRRRVSEYKLGGHVECIPWLPYWDMLHYVAIAQVGLALHQPIPRFFRVSRGNGRKFFTYMQCSVPIVGPGFGEVGQVVREEKCGVLVDTTDPQQIADAIIYLLEHPEDARTMGERGRKAVEEKYNWEIEKKKLLKIYQKLEREVNERQAGA